VPDSSPLLPLYLWDLRAQVEAQLRSLTTLQRTYDHRVLLPAAQRADDKARLVADLSEILQMNLAIRSVCEQALDEARALTE
jgi:hypothetical protein